MLEPHEISNNKRQLSFNPMHDKVYCRHSIHTAPSSAAADDILQVRASNWIATSTRSSSTLYSLRRRLHQNGYAIKCRHSQYIHLSTSDVHTVILYDEIVCSHSLRPPIGRRRSCCTPVSCPCQSPGACCQSCNRTGNRLSQSLGNT